MKSNLFALLVAAASLVASENLISAPTNLPESDQDRAEMITRFLAHSPKLEGAIFEVKVSDQIALVSATVDTLDQAEWIVSCVYATDGVFGAIQQLSVRPTGFDNASIEDDACLVFSHAKALHGSSLNAKVSGDAHLTIRGEAASPDQMDAARELASRIRGVQSIEIAAEINPLLPIEDEGIKAYLDLRIQDNPLLVGSTISVTLEDGVLTLKGKVPSIDVKELFVMSALVGGVMSCNSDQLLIEPSFATVGMSEKLYHPEDSVHVLKLIIEKDPRIPSGQLSMVLNQGELRIQGDPLPMPAAEALQQNCRGLPGIAIIEHDYKVTADSALTQNSPG